MNKVSVIKANIRRNIITSFREWLYNPETKIGGAERFWEYRAIVLLTHIDELEKDIDDWKGKAEFARVGHANLSETVARLQSVIRSYEEDQKPVTEAAK